jgi:hypothetical protein
MIFEDSDSEDDQYDNRKRPKLNVDSNNSSNNDMTSSVINTIATTTTTTTTTSSNTINEQGQESFSIEFPKEYEHRLLSAIFELGLKKSSPKLLVPLMPVNITNITTRSRSSTDNHNVSYSNSEFRSRAIASTNVSTSSNSSNSNNNVAMYNINTEHIKSHLQKYRIHKERSKNEFLLFYEEYMRDAFEEWNREQTDFDNTNDIINQSSNTTTSNNTDVTNAFVNSSSNSTSGGDVNTLNYYNTTSSSSSSSSEAMDWDHSNMNNYSNNNNNSPITSAIFDQVNEFSSDATIIENNNNVSSTGSITINHDNSNSQTYMGNAIPVEDINNYMYMIIQQWRQLSHELHVQSETFASELKNTSNHYSNDDNSHNDNNTNT